jgi:hypothetical protein
MAIPALAPGLRVALGGSTWAAAFGSVSGPEPKPGDGELTTGMFEVPEVVDVEDEIGVEVRREGEMGMLEVRKVVGKMIGRFGAVEVRLVVVVALDLVVDGSAVVDGAAGALGFAMGMIPGGGGGRRWWRRRRRRRRWTIRKSSRRG